LSVSAGVTTRVASQTPAMRPAQKVLNLVFSVKTEFLRNSLDPNLTAVFGIEKVSKADKPL